MNANELADELEHYLKGEEYDRLVWEIPDLLRQLQAENEALKALLKDESESFDRTASHMAGEYVAYKELTDAEIEEIYEKVYEEGHQNQVVALGRAILRKAQEK